MKLKRSEVVRVVELSPIALGDDELHFRLEVRRAGKRFVGQVWRWEFFRIQPTFPQRRGVPAHKPSDEQVLIRDDSTIDEVSGRTINGVLDEMVRRIEKRFSVG